MNFDPILYNTFLQAANAFLNQNVNQLSQQFCAGFLSNYGTNSPQTQQNVIQFYSYVTNEAMRRNNQPRIANDQQLFDIVGSFIMNVFNQWRQQIQMQQGTNTFGFQPQQTNFGGGNNGMFQNTGFGGAPRRSEPFSHLDDVPASDRITRTHAPTPTPTATAPAAAASAPMTFAVPTTNYVNHPLDDLPETGIDFISTKGRAHWAGSRPKDNRIVLAERNDLKTRDSQFTVNYAVGYHQEILDDPFQVARDFFKVAPDSLLGSVYLYSLSYNHLDILEVPTQDFTDLRIKCVEVMKGSSSELPHKELITKLQSMHFGPYQALTNYLVKHINRALWLACRLSTKPQTYIRIKSFEDLNELLSPQFKHSLTDHPNGRVALETIVSNVIWNALVRNVAPMFEDGDLIPTHAIQSSPAFPYSMQDVYPNKYAIPTSGEADAATFLERLKSVELSNRTYLLSRRRVVMTNVFNKNVLANLGPKPQMMATPVGPVLYTTGCALPFTDQQQTQGIDRPVKPFVSEEYPTDQLQSYLADPQEANNTEAERYQQPPVTLPLDQTIFATQYGVSPDTYFKSVDMFTTVDEGIGQNRVILAERDIHTLAITK